MRYFCDKCHKSFSTKFSYKSHYNNIHLQIKPFVCDYKDCGKQFVTKYRLEIHKLCHEGIKSYNCGYNICNSSAHCFLHPLYTVFITSSSFIPREPLNKTASPFVAIFKSISDNFSLSSNKNAFSTPSCFAPST